MDFSADQLNIETPEQVDLRFPIAGMGSRMLAIFFDSMIQVFIYVTLGLLAYVTSAYKEADNVLSAQSDTASKWLVALFVLANFLALTGYFIAFESLWNGQTPGKRLMKLRVLKDSGRSMTVFESMTRNLLRFVDYFPSFYVVGLATMLLNRQNKRLGDLAAGTIVVHERVADQPGIAHTSRSLTASFQPTPANGRGLLPTAQAAWSAGDRELPGDAVARLRSEDLHVIETFFSRALDLSPERRAVLAERVAATMCGRMQFSRPETLPPERLLELIAYKMRAQAR